MATFSDNFDRADSTDLGSNWTETLGNSTITSNALVLAPLDADVDNIYTGATFATTEQYLKVTITWSATGTYPWATLRSNAGGTVAYLIVFKPTEGVIEWFGGGSIQTATSVTLNSGDSYGITISGTGNDTVVRIWLNPTGDSPSAADTWGGDSSPDWTFTNNPGSPVDGGAGTYAGLGGYVDDGVTSFNDFFAGDIGGSASIVPQAMANYRMRAA